MPVVPVEPDPPNAAAWAAETTPRAAFVLPPGVPFDRRTITPEQFDQLAAQLAPKVVEPAAATKPKTLAEIAAAAKRSAG